MEERNSTQSQKSIGELVEKPSEGIETVFAIVEHLEGASDNPGKRLTIERRRLNKETPVEAPRAETQARCHAFYAASGFIEYLKKFGSKNTVILANPEGANGRGVVQAILDEKAEGGREVISMTPQTHPRWAPWSETLNRKLTLDQFRELITCNRKSIEAADGQTSRELLFTFRQIRMSTEVQLHSGVVKGAAAAVNGLVIRTAISGGGKESDTIALPESITIKTPVFVDEPETLIEVDLILGGKRDGTEIYVQLASADLREAQIAAFDALVDRLRSELSEDRFTVTHGAFVEARWERIPG